MDNSTIKVLLVDDDEDDYILTRDWLAESKDIQFELNWVADYDRGLEVIRQNKHDIYLLDYRLGSRNGLDLLREAIAQGCKAPIILLTGQGDREVDLEAMKAGAADYLDKTQLRAPLLERSIRYALERQQSEQKILEQAALLDVATDAIFVRDLENRILFWNKGAERLYGWNAEEAIGQDANQLLYKEFQPQLQAVWATLMAKGEWKGELNKLTKDNRDIVVESRWTLMCDEEEQPKSILVVNTDITEKKVLEAQFLRAQRMESIGTLAGGIAHDLNNILAPILMAAQLLQIKISDERSRQLLKTVETNTKRGAALVKQVLSFARGVQGERTVLQVRHLISEIRHVIKETFPRSIELSADISPDLWAVLGDATQLHQVLMNLCVNARDAMFDGGVLTICATNQWIDENYTRIHLDAHEGPYIAITISDTGVGIPPEVMDRIFEPFFTTKAMGKGTGLGLSTVIGIVKSHGGFVNVYSEVGQGTCFQVYLPAVEVPLKQPVPELELPRGHGELVLVIDDESSVCEMTRASLETYAYRVVTARNGQEAIATYADSHTEISVVLVDMMMPLMDGPSTIRSLKTIDPCVKIIAISGLATSDKVEAAIEAGIQGFLPKPYTARELLTTLDEVIQGNTQLGEARLADRENPENKTKSQYCSVKK